MAPKTPLPPHAGEAAKAVVSRDRPGEWWGYVERDRFSELSAVPGVSGVPGISETFSERMISQPAACKASS
jgi:hypothetical protein